jgi:hypothetical protein
LTIHISDVNDNQPQLTEFVVLVAQFEDEQLNDVGALGVIPAL